MIGKTWRILVWIALATSTAASASSADTPRPEHPTPDSVRAHWANLNGKWQFRFDAQDEGQKAKWFEPGTGDFDRTIVVPFGWESELSGIHKVKGAPNVGWYRRTFEVPGDFPKGDRVWLHFGAVDWQADVWVNGKHVAAHEGGYSPFEADITEALKPGDKNTLVVRAYDPTDPSLPTGKQVGWYTPTSGIWQTVWLESRPQANITGFTIETKLEPAKVSLEVRFDGTKAPGKYTVSARSDDPTVAPAETSFEITAAKPGERKEPDANSAALDLPVREPKLWSPDSPHLYNLTITLTAPGGKKDEVQTYFGLRTIARGKLPGESFERILLNGKPIYLRGALDQSFNPKGVYTAPDDAFLKHDIELAKSFNLNFLRIHIKPDEPRRLYWADKLGMMIMEDMPNTWEQNPRARKAWEATMREVVARDRNHPAIFCWVDFNETWGLGRPPRYKEDTDTQDWVEKMVALTRTLDSTRLVEDNSPCNYDHVNGSDLNSWHFYIDDHAGSKRHIENVVEQTNPGSGFNYCPGKTQTTAPLINSEYGSVSAGSGDRDISWGFRDLTTQLRKQPKIQGYIYTELDDIEWEHNGFVNYDRTPKEFGYSAFVPDMTVADLQGPDFVGYDAPPAVEAEPGAVIEVPVFVSHYSTKTDAPKLRWWVSGTDGEGEKVELPPQERPVEWAPYSVTAQKPVKFKIAPGPFVGALALVLEDSQGKRLAANFVNVVVRGKSPQPRVQRVNDHEVAIRFAPGEFSKSTWSGKAGTNAGAAWGQGKGSLVYKIKLPASVIKARPTDYELMFEASAKAARERVDWPDRVNVQDNPQTDVRKWPSTFELIINGQRIVRRALNDDPADARGVLSHMARTRHGSYGELIRVSTDMPRTALADLAAGNPLIVRLSVPEDADEVGGLCLYGANSGAYPFDPTLSIHTADVLPAKLGIDPDEPVTVDSVASHQTWVLPAGDNAEGRPATWWYTTEKPAEGWTEPGFDDHQWQKGAAGFGTEGTPSLRVGTNWETPDVWMRTRANLPALAGDDQLTLHLFHDEDVQVYVNGKLLHRSRGYMTTYGDIPLSKEQKALFHQGVNLVAVSCHQTGGGQGVDVGVSLLKGEK